MQYVCYDHECFHREFFPAGKYGYSYLRRQWCHDKYSRDDRHDIFVGRSEGFFEKVPKSHGIWFFFEHGKLLQQCIFRKHKDKYITDERSYTCSYDSKSQRCVL